MILLQIIVLDERDWFFIEMIQFTYQMQSKQANSYPVHQASEALDNARDIFIAFTP